MDREAYEGMEEEFPKRIFKEGKEPQVEHINNSCKMSLMDKIQRVLPGEYKKVKRDLVFAHILALHENSLGYSARLIHSMMCRQLVTDKKHEIWCVFGRRPLRFSLQEFYAVTGLNCSDNKMIINLNRWKDDNGFWSKLLKMKEKITIEILIDKHLSGVKKWKLVDKIRFVYVCVIAGLIMAKDEKKEIPHKYIKLVMDIDKVQSYPWGRDAFEFLVESIINTRDNLKNPKSYVLDGFSYGFQIWIMEAIPEMRNLLGKKIKSDLAEGPRCSNWKGVARVSYDEIILLKSTFGMTVSIT